MALRSPRLFLRPALLALALAGAVGAAACETVGVVLEPEEIPDGAPPPGLDAEYPLDAGAPDAGPVDAAGPADASSPDVGATDSGVPDDASTLAPDSSAEPPDSSAEPPDSSAEPPDADGPPLDTDAAFDVDSGP